MKGTKVENHCLNTRIALWRARVYTPSLTYPVLILRSPHLSSLSLSVLPFFVSLVLPHVYMHFLSSSLPEPIALSFLFRLGLPFKSSPSAVRHRSEDPYSSALAHVLKISSSKHDARHVPLVYATRHRGN